METTPNGSKRVRHSWQNDDGSFRGLQNEDGSFREWHSFLDSNMPPEELVAYKAARAAQDSKRKSTNNGQNTGQKKSSNRSRPAKFPNGQHKKIKAGANEAWKAVKGSAKQADEHQLFFVTGDAISKADARPVDKMILAVIDSLATGTTKHGDALTGPCTAANEYIADRIGEDPEYVRKRINKLQAKDMILTLGTIGLCSIRVVAPSLSLKPEITQIFIDEYSRE